MKGKVARDVVTLAGGNVLAQVVSLAAYFVITRIFSPEDYGLFNIFYSCIEVLLIASTCKYELAAIVAADEGEAAAVGRFALRMNTVVSAVLLLVATLLWLTDSLPGRYAQLGWMVMLVPMMVFFCGTSRVYSNLYNRFHRYAQIALSDNVNALVGSAMKIVLGLLGVTPAGLPMGAVVGQAAANVGYRVRLRSLGLPHVGKAECRAAARKYSNYPRFVATKDLVNTLSANLPFLWGAMVFDQAELGLFGLALTFVLQPVNLVSTAIERVLYARSADAVHAQQAVVPMVARLLLPMVAAGAVVCVVAWFVAEPVFAFCFGGRWAGCADYVRCLLPWALAAFASTSLMFVANIFAVQKVEFGLYGVMLLLRAVAFYIGVQQGSFLLAIRYFAAASAMVHVVLVVWYCAMLRRYQDGLR